MIDSNVLLASSNWYLNRKQQGADERIQYVLPPIFYTLKSLNIALNKLSLESKTRRPTSKLEERDHVVTWTMFPSNADYANFRAVLSLISDVYYMLEPIKSERNNLMELRPFINQLWNATHRFRNIRDFFSHLDQTLGDLDEFGITGPMETNCGIEYTKSGNPLLTS
jgi:hypothetical protein